MSLFEDIFRTILWWLCELAFFLMDMCYSVIKDLATINLSDIDLVWNWWMVMLLVIGFFILGRAFAMYVKTFIDEDALDKFNPLNMVVRIGAIALVIGLMPYTLNYMSSFTVAAIEGIETMLGGSDDIKNPSDVIIVNSMNLMGAGTNITEVDKNFDGYTSITDINAKKEMSIHTLQRHQI